jgi:DNA topoisomerase-1
LKSLVIVESPAKAKTINKILGHDFSVKASVGHIKDLPKKELGVDIDNDFKPHYEIIAGKEKIIKELRAAANNAENVYIATDPDREGEAIAYHIAEEITKNGQKKEGRKKKIYRVTFNEITEKAVKEAIKNPGDIDIHKVEAQQARRILDRLVGYNLSPFLWRKVRRGLSAGRVQSVAVRLIVDREREIESFKKREYWSIEGLFSSTNTPHTPFWARLYKYEDSLVINRDAEEDKQFLITDSETANKLSDEIKNTDFYLKKIDKRLKKKTPSPPFITSTLQQEAARKLKFPAKKTMMIAQQLYEGVELGKEGSIGLITYMRTDSFRVSEDAQKWARELIIERFGKDYVPENPPQYKSKKTAQEAHEAIRPTYPDKTPERVKPFLSKDQYALYNLIWNRFISSQMSPAQLEQTTFIISSKNEAIEFRASGTVIRFLGFMALYTESRDEIEEEEGGILPSLNEKERLNLIEVKPSQHFTQPPPRYTEATLVKALEEKGIGRPSTYASILSTIQERKYVEKNGDKRFHPTELGIIVNDLLVEKFPELIDIGFTAKMENELDAIENRKLKWLKVVKDFYKPFSKDLAQALMDMKKIKPKDIPTEEICEKCGSSMVIKWGRHGRFLACSNYPQCKNTKELRDSTTGLDSKESQMEEDVNEICEKCGAPMVVKVSKFGKFLACSKYPECKNTRPISTGVKCPLDEGDIVERRSKRGRRFWSCKNYPKCTFALWYKPIQKHCPKCNASFLVEKMTKDGKSYLQCLTKGCDYKENIETEKNAED